MHLALLLPSENRKYNENLTRKPPTYSFDLSDEEVFIES
jgi:hypothetical protein